MAPFHFTVYSNDAIMSKTGSSKRPRDFKWNLNVPITSPKYNKIAVESVFIRNVKANIIIPEIGSIRDYNINAQGELQYDPSESIIFKSINSVGTGTGATFIISNDEYEYSAGVTLRDPGQGYQRGDIMIILNEDGSVNEDGARVYVTVGSVFSSNTITHDLITVPASENEIIPNMVRIIAGGNADEKELFSIRCRYVTNSYDTRKSKHLSGGKIIYQGAMNFQNTNPKECFCYDLSSLDFLNGDFELALDSNYFNETGISQDLIFAVTFILME
jgi:hypothetical protein